MLTTESYYPNIDGGAIAQRNLVRELIRNGHEVRVVAPGNCFKNYQEDDNGYIIYRPRSVTLPGYMQNRYKFSLFPFFEVKKIVMSFKPDVINVCSPYPTSICGLYMAKKKNIALVSSIHVLPQNMLAPVLHTGLYNRLEPLAWKWLTWFYNQSHQAVVPTKTGGEIFKEHGLHVPVTAISNGIDTSRFTPLNDGTYLKQRFHIPDKPIVLYTGRINEEKSLDVLVRAIPIVLKRSDAHFVFVGSGGNYRQWLMTLAKKLGVSRNTSFIDFLSDTDFPNIYSLADVFVMPSEAVLQSIVTLEALASGLPIVAVDKGAVPELVTPENGILSPTKDSLQMAHAIIKILTDDSLRCTMGRKSLEVVKYHTMNFVCAQYEKVYRIAIDQSHQQ